jgi:DNA-directed RNA polymerase subunit RPC12/RpoP
MEVDCSNCGSIYDIRFNEEQTTEDKPLFCSFCGENIDEEEDHDYLGQMLKADFDPNDE